MLCMNERQLIAIPHPKAASPLATTRRHLGDPRPNGSSWPEADCPLLGDQPKLPDVRSGLPQLTASEALRTFGLSCTSTTMKEGASLERCPGCGGEFVAQDGPIHRYMVSSPACWAAYGEVLAAEYADANLMPVHRLSVDAFAVQHPGDGSRQAIQSIGLHLCRLHMQLEIGLSPEQANEFMLRAGTRKAEFPPLSSPPSFQVTVAEVAPLAGAATHVETVRRWAQSSWNDWSHVHGFVRKLSAAI